MIKINKTKEKESKPLDVYRSLVSEYLVTTVPNRKEFGSCVSSDGKKLFIGFGVGPHVGKNDKQKSDLWCFDLDTNGWKMLFSGGPHFGWMSETRMIYRREKLYLLDQNSNMSVFDLNEATEETPVEEKLNLNAMRKLPLHFTPSLMYKALFLYDETNDRAIFCGSKEDPVQVFHFNFATNEWDEIVTEKAPQIVSCVGGLINGDLFVMDGGGDSFWNPTIWKLNAFYNKWEKVVVEGDTPPKELKALVGCAHEQGILISASQSEVSSLYFFDTQTSCWKEYKSSSELDKFQYGSMNVMKYDDRSYICRFGHNDSQTCGQSHSTLLISEEILASKKDANLNLYHPLQFYNREYPDVTIVHVQTEKQYQCHRHLLARNSSYFENLFLQYPENAKNQKVELSLEDPLDFFPRIISYIYTGKMELLENQIVQLRAMSFHLDIKSLNKKVVHFLHNFLTRNNVINVLKSAIDANDQEFIETSLAFISQNIIHLQEEFNEIYLSLSESQMVYFLEHPSDDPSSDYCSILLSFVKKYMKHHSIEKNTDSLKSFLQVMAKSVLIDPDTAARCITMCQKLQFQDLSSAFTDILISKFIKLTDTTLVYDLEFDVIVRILSDSKLSIACEDAVLDICIEYAKRNSLTDQQKGQLFQCVRIPYITYDRLGALKTIPYITKERLIQSLLHLVLMKEESSYVVGSDLHLKARTSSTFVHVSDWDTNGILYYLGTSKGSRSWTNPMKLGAVHVTTKVQFEAGNAENIVGRANTSTNLKSSSNNWITIEFRTCKINPSKYTLKHTGGRSSEFIRSWKLEGSLDNVKWDLLDQQLNQQLIVSSNGTGTFSCKSDSLKFYRFIRLTQTAKNSSNSDYLSVQGMEFYGVIV